MISLNRTVSELPPSARKEIIVQRFSPRNLKRMTSFKPISRQSNPVTVQFLGTGYSAKMVSIGNQALVFLQTSLVGDIYPYGGRLTPEVAHFGRNQIIDFLSYLHPRRTGGLLYTNLRTFLHFNTRDFFNLLTMAFDNKEFLNDVDTSKRRAFCDILLRVMVDDVQFSSHQISILFNFLSRQLAKAGQQHIFVQGMLFEQVNRQSDHSSKGCDLRVRSDSLEAFLSVERWSSKPRQRFGPKYRMQISSCWLNGCAVLSLMCW